MKDLKRIKQLIITHTGLPIDEKGNWNRDYTTARYMFYFLARKYTHYSDKLIANEVQVNRATVVNGISLFEDRMKYEPEMRKVYDTVEATIKSEIKQAKPKVNNIIAMLPKTETETIIKVYRMLKKEQHAKRKLTA